MWLVWFLQATGSQIGMIVNSLTNIGASFIIAFYFSWKLTLVIMCFLPLIGLSGVFQAKMLTGFENENKKSMEEAGQVRTERWTYSEKQRLQCKILTFSHRCPVKLSPTSGRLQAWPKRSHLWNHLSRNLSFHINLPRREPTSMGSVLVLPSVSSSWHMLLHLHMEAIWLAMRGYNTCLFSGW